MNSFLLMTGSGPLVILTSHAAIEDDKLLDKLLVKGIDKFIAYEVPYDLAKKRYANHFKVVANDLHDAQRHALLKKHGYELPIQAEY